MSKLTQVKAALYRNPKVGIVDVKTSPFKPAPPWGGLWSETYDIFVAPRKGIYTAAELQAMLVSLVPDIEPNASDSFEDSFAGFDSHGSLQLGKLYFDEEIGVMKTRDEVELTDEDLLGSPPQGFVGGKRVSESETPLLRRTWVRLYPNVRHALTAAQEGKNEYTIPFRDLRPGERLARLLARMGFRG